MKKTKLTKKELEQMTLAKDVLLNIKGGILARDSTNDNQVYRCTCTYNDTSWTDNQNGALDCRCVCT